MYECMYAICVCVCVYVCNYVCMYVCLYIYIYIYIYNSLCSPIIACSTLLLTMTVQFLLSGPDWDLLHLLGCNKHMHTLSVSLLICKLENKKMELKSNLKRRGYYNSREEASRNMDAFWKCLSHCSEDEPANY